MPFWWYYSVGGGEGGGEGEESGRRPDLAWVTSHLPINLALSEVIIRNVLRAAAAGGNMHGHCSSHSRCGECARVCGHYQGNQVVTLQ